MSCSAQSQWQDQECFVGREKDCEAATADSRVYQQRIIRDLRLWHGGKPNMSEQIRVMLATIHSAPWDQWITAVTIGSEVGTSVAVGLSLGSIFMVLQMNLLSSSSSSGYLAVMNGFINEVTLIYSCTIVQFCTVSGSTISWAFSGKGSEKLAWLVKKCNISCGSNILSGLKICKSSPKKKIITYLRRESAHPYSFQSDAAYSGSQRPYISGRAPL